MYNKLVAIIGRPNVGKSTIFNRLANGRSKAIVHDMPGVTRDRKYSKASLSDLEFQIIDTPGLDGAKGEEIEARMSAQTMLACEEADIVLFVIDNLSGVTATDIEFAALVRKHSKDVVLLVNKCEKQLNHDNSYYKLGFGSPVAISAEHGLGFADLYDAVSPLLRNNVLDAAIDQQLVMDSQKSLQLAIVGRPNAGKSTFINAILGSKRMLTGAEAGITRESVQTEINYKNNKITIIDTAGLRKRANVTMSLEKLSTSDTINSIKYANTVILMLDATAPLEHQDLTIANYTITEGRNLVIAINKADLIKDEEHFKDEFSYKLSTHMPHIRGVPVVYISAINQKNVYNVLDKALDSYKLWDSKISTSKLNDWLGFACAEHPMPISKKLGRRVKLKYITQINSRPPTFKIFTNLPDEITEAYKKYLLNSLRDSFNLPGVPIRMRFIKTDNPYAHKAKKGPARGTNKGVIRSLGRRTNATKAKLRPGAPVKKVKGQ